jgi:Mitochondrial carrier protein
MPPTKDTRSDTYNSDPVTIQLDNSMMTSLTYEQSIKTGIVCGSSSSIINHPFQVLRARYQNSVAVHAVNPSIPAPKVLTFDPRILFKGFSATLLGMWCMTVTQSVSKKIFSPSYDGNATKSLSFNALMPSILGGLWSAVITTPLEGTILRQSKTLSNTQQQQHGTFQSMKQFTEKYGIRRAYHGGIMIGIRTTIVGSAFSVWTPIVATHLQDWNVIQSAHSATIVAGTIVGTICAALSQPFESIRIEQQFTANETNLLTIHQAGQHLLKEHGVQGLFKGGSYRIPRTAPGIVINAVVYNELETFFHRQNQQQQRLALLSST